MITPKLQQAIQVSAIAHRIQLRKGTNIPYITHPYSVMLIASQVTHDESTLCASLLHDVLEDGDPKEYSEQDMLREFGPEVTATVKAVTKDPAIKGWKNYNQAYIDTLRATPNAAALVVCAADKIHNLSDVLSDYEQVGEKLWTRFNAGKEDQKWWYRSVLSLLQARIPDNPLVNELADLVSKLEAL